MTIDEAIKDIKENIQPSVGGLSLEMAIQALEEIEEYRVKEFQCHLAQQEGISIGYNKAIDEFYDEILNFEDYIEPVDTSDFGAVLLYSGIDITNMIVKIKERMKAGGVWEIKEKYLIT